MTDLDGIIEGCRKGDAQMQSRLYKLYSPRFYALCCRYAADTEVANDALVDGFLSIFMTIDSYSGKGSFEGWMQTIFVRATIKRLRQKTAHNSRQLSNDAALECPYSVDLDRQIDVRAALEHAMGALGDSQRVLVNMIAIDDLSFAQAAQELGQPVSTIKWHYYQAMQIVRRRMKNRL